MSNVPLPRPGPLGLIQYAGIDMLQYAGKISAAKDAEISGLQNFKTMHLEMVAKWAGDIGEALGEPSEDFKPDDLIALAGKVKIQRDALRADNIRLQNEVVMPLRERVRELTTQAMFNASTIERLRAEVAGLREDAERYREWKRAFREGECALWNALCEGQSDAEHDAAIDAALAARKGEA